MPSVTSPPQIVREISTITENGEVTINLNLAITIKLEQDNVSVAINQEESPKKIQKTFMEIPDIPTISTEDLIQFGKEAL